MPQQCLSSHLLTDNCSSKVPRPALHTTTSRLQLSHFHDLVCSKPRSSSLPPPLETVMMTIVPCAFWQPDTLRHGSFQDSWSHRPLRSPPHLHGYGHPPLSRHTRLERLNLGFSSCFNICQAPFGLLRTSYTSCLRLQSLWIQYYPSVRRQISFRGGQSPDENQGRTPRVRAVRCT